MNGSPLIVPTVVAALEPYMQFYRRKFSNAEMSTLRSDDHVEADSESTS